MVNFISCVYATTTTNNNNNKGRESRTSLAFDVNGEG